MELDHASNPPLPSLLFISATLLPPTPPWRSLLHMTFSLSDHIHRNHPDSSFQNSGHAVFLLFFVFVVRLTRVRHTDSWFPILLRHQQSTCCICQLTTPILRKTVPSNTAGRNARLRNTSFFKMRRSDTNSTRRDAHVLLLWRCPRCWITENAHIEYTHYSAPHPSSQQSTARLRFITREVTHRLPLLSPLPPLLPSPLSSPVTTLHIIPKQDETQKALKENRRPTLTIHEYQTSAASLHQKPTRLRNMV